MYSSDFTRLEAVKALILMPPVRVRFALDVHRRIDWISDHRERILLCFAVPAMAIFTVLLAVS